MGGDLNALGIILVIVLTAAILVRGGARSGSLRRAPLAVGIAFSVLVLYSCFISLWDYGSFSSHEALIPPVCLVLLLTFARPGRLRTIAAMAVALSTFVLSYQIILLVNCPVYSAAGSPTYMVNPRWVRRLDEANSLSKLHDVRSWLGEFAKDDNHEYPAGWLSEPPLRQFIPPDDLPVTRTGAVEFHPFWHTPLTGLYWRWRNSHRLDMWYPGGRLKEGLKRLEFRPR